MACVILPQTVSAAKKDWQENSYNFSNVRRIFLMKPTSNADLLIGNSDLINRLYSVYQENAKYSKCEIVTENQTNQSNDLKNFSQVADLVIKCNIKEWSENSKVVPERTTWEQKEMSRRVRDSDGDWTEETYEVTVPVVQPPYRVEVSKIEVLFEVYDTKTGNLVFTRRDVRDREEKNSQDGMFRRLCYQFFQDLGKIIK